MLATTICKSCASTNLMNLHTEVNIHLPGLRSLDHPPIFAFPTLTVCLNCGHAEAKLSEIELTQIKESALSKLSESI